jgi:hypothetical protein
MPIHKIPIFLENPYDVQAILEGLKIAQKRNKELLYMDRLLATLRLDPEGDIVNISYRILLDLELLKLETAKN